MLHIDIETYSGADLAREGTWRYTHHPDFEIMLMSAAKDDEPVVCFDMTVCTAFPEYVLDALHGNELIVAHNAEFEYLCLQKYLGEKLPFDNWRCSAMAARYCGFPGSLSGAGEVLGIKNEKMKIGTALINYFCKPCKPTKSNGGRSRNRRENALEKWELFKEYNIQDVEAEREIWRTLEPFPVPDWVWEDFRVDFNIKYRGVKVDVDLVNAALFEIDKEENILAGEAGALTGIKNPKSPTQILTYIVLKNPDIFENKWRLFIPNSDGRGGRYEPATAETKGAKLDLTGIKLTKKDVERYKKVIKDPVSVRLLEIRQLLGQTSVAKFDALADSVCEDGRVRGLTQFYGAARTGRWAGRIVQVQNLPKARVCKNGSDDDEVACLKIAREGLKEGWISIFGKTHDVLPALIRAAFISENGKLLIDADFSAIEARVIAWLAGEQWRLDVFNGDGKIYEASAAAMFGVDKDLIVKGKKEYELRQKGKVAELALGYQGSLGALKTMGALEMGLEEKELPDIVRRWRAASPSIVKFWYDVQRAAMNAVINGGLWRVGSLEFEVVGSEKLHFMRIGLPSKRDLMYPYVRIGENKFGEPAVVFEGPNKDTGRWQIVDTYGGKLVENIVQAVARDCLAHGIKELENAGFEIVFHVHDEVVIECSEDRLNEVCGILSVGAPWANGLPLRADGWAGTFYRKG